MNGLADPFWANFERFLVVLWPPFEKGVRSDLILIVCKDTATFSENLIKFVQRLEVFIDDGFVGQKRSAAGFVVNTGAGTSVQRPREPPDPWRHASQRRRARG